MLQVNVPNDAPEMEFEFLVGDVYWETYGGKWISKESFHNGDFEYWLVIDFINMDDACGEPDLHVQIDAVSPEEAGKEQLEQAISGYSDIFIERVYSDPVSQVEALHSYGTSAPLWQDSIPLTEVEQEWGEYDEKAEMLVKRAKQVAPALVGLFGFAMDGPVNRIGSTGWDFIKGDITAGLDRWREENK